VLQEDPVFFDTLFTYGADKIGYVVYHQFIPEPYQEMSKEYDKKLDAIFAKFKTANVNALVVDLRYNPGGYVSSATNFASLIGKLLPMMFFITKNTTSRLRKPAVKNMATPTSTTNSSPKARMSALISTHVVFLVSSRSASASELMINGLKPYMTVTLVGSKTVGKNVGSITIERRRRMVLK
jgi:carboxyl-terminal processing protease